MIARALAAKSLSSKCQRTSLHAKSILVQVMAWCIGKQAITRVNADQDLCHHKASLSTIGWTEGNLHKPSIECNVAMHDDVIKWKHFPRYWRFVQGIHRSPVKSPHKGQWRGALMFSLICVWINDWVNNRQTDDLRRQRSHYDVIVMVPNILFDHGKFMNLT